MSSNQLHAVIVNARDKLAKGFCKGHIALDMDGREVMATSPHAVAYCAVGALWAAVLELKTTAGLFHTVIRAVEKEIGKAYDPMGLVTWNNEPERTQEEVVSVFTRAAQLVA